MRSDQAIAQLRASWSFPRGAGFTGSGAAAPEFTGDIQELLTAAGVRAGRPVLVYVCAKEEPRDSGGHTFEQSHFADERVALAAKAFNLLKLRDGSAVAKAPALAGTVAPRIVVIDSSGKRVGSIEGDPSASGLYALMKRTALSMGARPLDQFVRDYRRLLDEVDTVDAARDSLERRRDELAANPTPALRRRVAELAERIRSTSERLVRKERELLGLPEKS